MNKHFLNVFFVIYFTILNSGVIAITQKPTIKKSPALDLGNVSSYELSKNIRRTTLTHKKQKIDEASLETINRIGPENVSEPITNTGDTKFFLPHYAQYYCSCDLQAGDCDLNCCCDRDCNSEALKVFSCLATALQQQTLFEDKLYSHEMPSCKTNDGWLCVFRSNNNSPSKNQQNSHIDINKNNKWPELLMDFKKTPLNQDSAYYKYGQPLQLLQLDTEEYKTLELPSAFESEFCHLKHTVNHLIPIKSSCLFSNKSQMQLHFLMLLNITNTHKLLSIPHSQQDVIEYDDDGVISIQVCRQFAVSNVVCFNNTSELQLDSNMNAIELQLQHNYTHIVGALLLVKENMSGNRTDTNFWQHFEIQFMHSNKSDFLKEDSKAKALSGPLGYLQGAPILITTLISQNSSGINHIYSYNTINETDKYHWLPLFTKKSHSNECTRNLEQRHVVRFGENIVKQCHLRKGDVKLAQPNVTTFCQALQADIWIKLLPTNCINLTDVSQVYISRLGRPSLKDWLSLQLDHGSSELLEVKGEQNDNTNSFICRNMVLSIRYEFLVGFSALLDNAPHQRVVHQAGLVLGERHNLVFDFADEQVDIPLTLAVMFYNSPNDALSIVSAGVSEKCFFLLTFILNALALLF